MAPGVEVCVVDAGTGEGLAGAKISSRTVAGERTNLLTTDKRGIPSIDVPAHPGESIRVEREGYYHAVLPAPENPKRGALVSSRRKLLFVLEPVSKPATTEPRTQTPEP